MTHRRDLLTELSQKSILIVENVIDRLDDATLESIGKIKEWRVLLQNIRGLFWIRKTGLLLNLKFRNYKFSLTLLYVLIFYGERDVVKKLRSTSTNARQNNCLV